ncbi:cytochrome c oxidase subunit II [Sabulicella rubraurantiaca]|uniref:cytochrome c oxidase subunit II n=1 Tax=Sabulicella rubraurantiaca TaxID=2811429 RepID=UPI001A96D2DF|nr:cytochrome c oxidase subunit II [Sabulicella rubraurantiaca]
MALLAAILLPGACDGPHSVLDPAGDQAAHLHGLLNLMLWVCGIMYALVLGFLAWALWRTIRRRDAAPPGPDESQRPLRIGLGAWAGLVVAGLILLSTASFLVDRSLAAAREHEALSIRITAHQWWWRVAYRDPASGEWIETANELYLPAGRTARLELVAEDVIHSFWVPNLSGKLDVIPGRTNLLDITPRRVGWYRGNCAEFCGLQHTLMALDVRVAPPEEFSAWLAAQAASASQPSDPVLARGQDLFVNGTCAACHVVRGTPADGRSGPDLTHVGTRRSIAGGALPMNRGNLQGWFLNPEALKPGTLMPAVVLPSQEADALARYLEWLK